MCIVTLSVVVMDFNEIIKALQTLQSIGFVLPHTNDLGQTGANVRVGLKEKVAIEAGGNKNDTDIEQIRDAVERTAEQRNHTKSRSEDKHMMCLLLQP